MQNSISCWYFATVLKSLVPLPAWPCPGASPPRRGDRDVEVLGPVLQRLLHIEALGQHGFPQLYYLALCRGSHGGRLHSGLLLAAHILQYFWVLLELPVAPQRLAQLWHHLPFALTDVLHRALHLTDVLRPLLVLGDLWSDSKDVGRHFPPEGADVLEYSTGGQGSGKRVCRVFFGGERVFLPVEADYLARGIRSHCPETICKTNIFPFWCPIIFLYMYNNQWILFCSCALNVTRAMKDTAKLNSIIFYFVP